MRLYLREVFAEFLRSEKASGPPGGAPGLCYLPGRASLLSRVPACASLSKVCACLPAKTRFHKYLESKLQLPPGTAAPSRSCFATMCPGSCETLGLLEAGGRWKKNLSCLSRSRTTLPRSGLSLPSCQPSVSSKSWVVCRRGAGAKGETPPSCNIWLSARSRPSQRAALRPF